MQPESSNPSHPQNPEKKHEFKIFIDAVPYLVSQTSMTGAEIKALAGKDAQYQLYLEEQGDQADKAIGDNEALSIRNDMHFYAIPPTTMGDKTREV